jgi:hypothetical protein
MARSSRLSRDKSGKSKSARAKVGGECSTAMSQWKSTGQMTPSIAATLGKCRAKARLLREGATRREMGQEARAQAMESRASRGGPLTAKDRLAKAKQLRAERANREPSVLAPRPGEDDVRRRFRESNAKPTPAAGRNTPARLALARAKRADRAASREPSVLSGSTNEAAVRQSFRDIGLDRTIGSAPKRAKTPARVSAPQPSRTTNQPAPGSYAERARKRRADRSKEAAAVAPMPPGSERLPIRDSIAPAASQEERRRHYAARDDAAYNLRALRASRQYKEAQRASRTVATPAPTAAALRTTVTSTPTVREQADRARQAKGTVQDRAKAVLAKAEKRWEAAKKQDDFLGSQMQGYQAGIRRNQSVIDSTSARKKADKEARDEAAKEISYFTSKLIDINDASRAASKKRQRLESLGRRAKRFASL